MSDTDEKLPLTFEGIVRSVALMFGHVPTHAEVGFILWERTGFPEFFMDDPARECAEQVFRHYSLAQYGFQPCACCGAPAEAFVCESCDRLRVMDEDRGSYHLAHSGSTEEPGT